MIRSHETTGLPSRLLSKLATKRGGVFVKKVEIAFDVNDWFNQSFSCWNTNSGPRGKRFAMDKPDALVAAAFFVVIDDERGGGQKC